jgi:hypothetical protein
MSTTNNPVPRTFAEVAELVSQLRSRKAVNLMLIAHIKVAYKDTDTGRAEMRVAREDNAYVSQAHLEQSIIGLEHSIELIDAELEELQNQPVGGGAPPAAEQPSPEPTKAADPITEAVKAQVAEKKGTPSGKPRAQGSGAS